MKELPFLGDLFKPVINHPEPPKGSTYVYIYAFIYTFIHSDIQMIPNSISYQYQVPVEMK